MATLQERAELHKTIWKIANDLRGSVDGWEFKDLKAAKHLFKNKCYYHHNANDRFGSESVVRLLRANGAIFDLLSELSSQ